MIAPASINEVMSRADIVDVIGQFVRLKKRGANYMANCPFHNEKSPSFNVSPAKGIYKCFGCGKAGNVVSFIQEHEKLTYPESIRWLADYYKIALQETERTPEQQQQQQAGEALRILNEYAANYFHDFLLNSEEGQLIGLSYFKQRGFRKEIIERFRLGYNAEYNDQFFQTSVAKGHNKDLLEKAGLIKNRNGIYHDVYRGRVIFPIQSMTGRILGFGARILKSNEKAPKYINTPENELYLKSKILYGMYQSRTAIGKQDECFLVEGYTDVISLHQGGVENVVASSGTSLTEDQLRLIGQLTRNLTILYDGDAAGIKAALRGLDMALGQSFNVQLVLLPDGEDPDSFIQKSGVTRFHEFVKEHKQDVISFRLQIGLIDVGSDPVKKSKLVNEIAESISRINKAEDFALQEHYIKTASAKLQVDETGLVNLVNKYIRDRIDNDSRHKQRKEEAAAPANISEEDLAMAAAYGEGEPELIMAKPIAKDEPQEWALLRILIEYGHLAYDGFESVAKMIEERVDTAMIENQLVGKLYNEYFDHFTHFGSIPEIHYFINHPEPDIRTRMATLLHLNADISPNWKEKYGIDSVSGPMNYVVDVDSTMSYFELKKILAIQDQLTQLLHTEQDPAKQQRMMMKFMELRKMEREILKRHQQVVFKSLKSK
ncbi:DNA primase [Flavipsychrobacter stenotrophus]|uniref:DNA primase n=1 Tax=Flavipsychrobacter stenotrophus TaxID=2077091 RepID=UPI00105730E7|nr:DNA primase [Flavipsychrobacter stenotrophus]